MAAVVVALLIVAGGAAFAARPTGGTPAEGETIAVATSTASPGGTATSVVDLTATPTPDPTREPMVVHNTVMSSASATNFFSSIDYRFPQTVVNITNNLTVRITQRDGAMGTDQNNLSSTPLDYFVAPPDDFHLTDGATMAIDAGLPLDPAVAGVDIDGDPHGDAPDIGADER